MTYGAHNLAFVSTLTCELTHLHDASDVTYSSCYSRRIFVILKLADIQLAALEDLCGPKLHLTGGPQRFYDC